jgi:hypothetical protein
MIHSSLKYPFRPTNYLLEMTNDRDDYYVKMFETEKQVEDMLRYLPKDIICKLSSPTGKDISSLQSLIKSLK